jgi:catechol 2,3-dioxygenase-like lactoylglutathione lyase family enzyme
MIDHTGINVSDLERSAAFYERALAPLGYAIRRRIPGAVGFGVGGGHGQSLDPGGDFWISAGPPLTPRSHIAFSAAHPLQRKLSRIARCVPAGA